MGNASAKAVEMKVPESPAPSNTEKPKLKPCCACPETKRARDAWMTNDQTVCLMLSDCLTHGLTTSEELCVYCHCPEICIIEHGEENCGPLIEEHKACMRKMGFNI